MTTDLRPLILRTIAEVSGTSAGTLCDDDYLSDLGCDSLDLVDIVRTVENETGIEVPTKYLVRIKTVGDAVNVIEKLRDAGGTAECLTSTRS